MSDYITLKKNSFAYRDDEGNYKDFDLVSDETIEDRVNQINQAGTDALTAIDTKVNSFSDYSETQQELASLKDEIYQIYNVPLTIGGISSGGGADVERNDRVRSDYIKKDLFYGTVEDTGTKENVMVYGYGADKAYINHTDWAKSVDISAINSSWVYIRILVQSGNINDISVQLFDKTATKRELDDFAESIEDLSFFEVGSKNQIARLGWNVYSNSTPPEQTIPSYALAYKNSCRIMLCDIRVTADGKLVCWHDQDFGAELGTNTVRHTDGSQLSASEKAQTITSLTMEQIDSYDFGLYKGSQYAGTKMLRLENFIKWCGNLNCYPMFEIKGILSETHISEIAKMCKKYGVFNRVIIAEDESHYSATKSYWLQYLPNAIHCVRGGSRNFGNASAIAKTLADDGQEVMISFTDEGSINQSRLNFMIENNIKVEFSEVTSVNGLKYLYDNGYLDVIQYVVSSYVNVNRWIADKLLE